MSEHIRVRARFGALSKEDGDGLRGSLEQELHDLLDDDGVLVSVSGDYDNGWEASLRFDVDTLAIPTVECSPPRRSWIPRVLRPTPQVAGDVIDEDRPPVFTIAVTRALEAIDEAVESLAYGEGRIVGISSLSATFE